MLQKILLTLSCLVSSFTVFSQTIPADTLLQANSAKELSILSDESTISITVKNMDNKGENFYYDTEGGSDSFSFETTISKFRDVKNISIIELDGKRIAIHFTNNTDNPNSLSLDIPDPENRTVKSNVGTRRTVFGINLSKKGKSSWNLTSAGLGLGWVTPVNAVPDLNASMGRSMEFTWAMILGVRWSYGLHSISAGVGIDWRNYTMKNNRYFHKEEDGTISLRNFEPGVEKGSSRLQTFSLQVPILYNIGFKKNKNFGFTFGPIINFNTGGHITTKYSTSISDYSIRTGSIHPSPVTVDIMGVLHWNWVGIYARYAPMRVLKSSTGLDFSSFSTGLMLMF